MAKLQPPQTNDAHKTKPNVFRVFILLCIYRLANAWLIRTQFDPDEYWQTLEPAYCLAFGSDDNGGGSYGCALTWEWTRRWSPSNETVAIENGGGMPLFLLQATHGPVRSYVSILPTYWYYLACRTLFKWAHNSSFEFLKHFIDQNASYIVSKGPAFLHAITVAAPTDLSVWLIALRLENLDGPGIEGDKSTSWSFWALFLSVTSWFNGYALIRTYANCFETVCLAVGIVLLGPELFGNSSSYKINHYSSKSKLAFVLGGLSACVRFTSLAAWVPLGLIVAIRSGINSRGTTADISKPKPLNDSDNSHRTTDEHHYNYRESFRVLFGLCALYGAVGVVLGCCIDRIMYGFWAIPLLGNFHFNVVLGLGSLYGTHPLMWYIYAGIPAICGAILPPFLVETSALSKSLSNTTTSPNSSQRSTKAMMSLLAIIIPYIILHSFSKHKEFRFILPILPHVIVIAAHAMVQLFKKTNTTNRKRLRNSAIIGFSLLNFPHLLYLGTIHQRGPIAVNQFLTNTIAKASNGKQPVNIHFLMGCHSSPLYSHLHIPNVRVQAWHLDCSPDCRSKSDVVCESDAFSLDPLKFISVAYGDGGISDSDVCKHESEQCTSSQLEQSGRREVPMFAVVMQDDADKIKQKLNQLGMSHLANIRHTIKSLTWHERNDDTSSRDIATNHYAATILSLIDVNFEHIEIYQSINIKID